MVVTTQEDKLSRAHQFIEAARLGEIATMKPPAHAICAKLIDDIVEALPGAHKFTIIETEHLYDEAVYETTRDLWCAGGLRPPFESCWIEIESPQYNETAAYHVDTVGPAKFKAEIDKCIAIAGPYPGGLPLLPTVDAIIVTVVNRIDHQWYCLGETWMWDGERWCGGNTAHPDVETTETGMHQLALLLSAFCLMTTAAFDERVVPAPKSLNKAREAKGKPPLFEHRLITLRPWAKPEVAGGGTHASPRLHWRRGHSRRLRSGSYVAVAPCLVGLADRGFVSKDYVMRVPDRAQ